MNISRKAWSLVLAVALTLSTFAGTAASAKAVTPYGAVSDLPMEQRGEIVTPKFDDRNTLQSYRAGRNRSAFKDSFSLVKDSDLSSNCVDEVTPVLKDQAGWGDCWAFSTLGSGESSLYKDSQNDVDFSERHLAYFTFNGSNNSAKPEDGTQGDTWTGDTDTYPDDAPFQSGGNIYMVMSTLTRGTGAETEQAVPYPSENDFQSEDTIAPFRTVNEANHFDSVYQLRNANILPNLDANGTPDGTAVKQALTGGTTVSVALNFDQYATNLPNGYKYPTYFYNTDKKSDHMVQIVGWNDNIPASNFKGTADNAQPAGNGGWIIKNQWGDVDVNHGSEYFYVSYYDTSLQDFCAFTMDSTQNRYAHNYQYDGVGEANELSLSNDRTAPAKFSNVFTATGEQHVSAVSFYTTDADASYSIQVYTGVSGSNPESGTAAFSTPQIGTEAYAGYHTVDLSQAVNISDGQKYSIVMTLQNPHGNSNPLAVEFDDETNGNGIGVSAKLEAGQSYVYASSGTSEFWMDMVAFNQATGYPLGNVCLKAFTDDGHVSNPTPTPTPSQPSNPGKTTTTTGTTTVTPAAASGVTVAKDAAGTSTVTVTTQPDGSPTVSGGTSAISATVDPGAVTVAEGAGTAQKPANAVIELPDSTIISQLNGSGVQAVAVTLNAPSAFANGTAGNVNVTIRLSAADLKAAAAAKKGITVNVVDASTGKIVYSWTISGTALAASGATPGDINLALNIKTSSLDSQASRLVPASATGLALTFGNNGQLPCSVSVRMRVSDYGYKPGQTLYPYYDNEAQGQLETFGASAVTVGTDGYATIVIDHCSKYLLLPKQVAAVPGLKLDTGAKLSLKAGKAYQFKITASGKPVFVSGNSSVFKVTFVGSRGNDYFFLATAVGKAGSSAGFYVNNEKTPRTVGTIIA